MTITTEELRKLVSEATQDDFPTTRHNGKSKLDGISVTIAAELITARAKLEAAEKLAKALDALIDGRNWTMSTEKFIAAKAALATWEASQ